jgi:hypothetical protein
MIMSGTFSQANNQCGEYELKGVLRYKESENKQFIYVVNEGTQSETHFFIETIEQLKKVASLINRPTKISVQLTKPLDGTRGYVNEVIFVKLRKSDPLLHGGDTGYELVKSMPCQ